MEKQREQSSLAVVERLAPLSGDWMKLVAVVPPTVIIITQTAAIALEPLTTHPDEWAEPSHK